MENDGTLTKLASHEVATGLFGILAVHLACLWVKLREHVSMEAIVVFLEAEGRRAVWHGLELFVIYSLVFDVVVEDVVVCRE